MTELLVNNMENIAADEKEHAKNVIIEQVLSGNINESIKNFNR
jgi:hypothetical protein